MSKEIYTKEQEREVLEETLRDMGYYLNHNYFIAERGIRPDLQWYFNWSHYITAYFGFYCLLFEEDHLVMLSLKYLQNDPEKHSLKINYADITDFFISRPLIQYCLGFKVENKRYYFYIDANASYSFTGLDFSDKNFHYLMENHFKGLMK
ncbi:hypothetical protein ACFP65_07900 [Marinilactibacillus sp. GCM10026970]|uniref:hypothetical protein n=1 Tax=Marinilactibacillus sp. GCM10026970 TaxID=3252642 RepID=UPI0036205FFD